MHCMHVYMSHATSVYLHVPVSTRTMHGHNTYLYPWQTRRASISILTCRSRITYWTLHKHVVKWITNPSYFWYVQPMHMRWLSTSTGFGTPLRDGRGHIGGGGGIQHQFFPFMTIWLMTHLFAFWPKITSATRSPISTGHSHHSLHAWGSTV
jgi:hypothetical protein